MLPRLGQVGEGAASLAPSPSTPCGRPLCLSMPVIAFHCQPGTDELLGSMGRGGSWPCSPRACPLPAVRGAGSSFWPQEKGEVGFP
jgi:hypothetical protein